MPIATITEYSHLAVDAAGHHIQAGQEPAINSQSVTYAASTPITVAFNHQTHFVRVHVTDVAHLKFAKTPVATANDARLPAGATEFFGVVPLQKVAVYDGTT